MVRIRLRRMGKKKQPSYRVVVADSRAPRDGRFIESIGFYDPLTDPPTIRINEERALYWLSQGAQPTEVAAGLLRKVGVLEKQGEDEQIPAPTEATEEEQATLTVESETAVEAGAASVAEPAPETA